MRSEQGWSCVNRQNHKQLIIWSMLNRGNRVRHDMCMCVHMLCVWKKNCWKESWGKNGYVFLKQTGSQEKGPEVLRGQSSAHPLLQERPNNSSRTKRDLKSPTSQERGRKEQRQKKIQRQRPVPYQRKISVRDKASRQGVVFSQFEASCHHH